jgi:hypothetical protein
LTWRKEKTGTDLYGCELDKDGRCLDPTVEKLIRSVVGNLMNCIHHAICPSITLERLLRRGVGVTARERAGEFDDGGL